MAESTIAVEAAGRRWRDLFLDFAAADPAAVSAASKRFGLPGTDLSVRSGPDKRPERQRIAERFLHTDHADEWEQTGGPPAAGLPSQTTLVFCPGLVNTLIPVRAFARAFASISGRDGARILVADGHPLRSCEANVADLAETIERGTGFDASYERIDPGSALPPQEVILFGYSKGAADALTLLVARPDLADRVRAVVCWAGAVGGSHLADGTYEQVKDFEMPKGRISDALIRGVQLLFPVLRLERLSERIEESDLKAAVRDLTTGERTRFVEEHGPAIDALGIPVFSVSGATAALEVPAFQVQGYRQIQGIDGVNDMQVSLGQSRWPGSAGVNLGTVHGHHWDMSYDPFPLHLRGGFSNLDHRFPREAAILATVGLLAELGVAR
jgi:pimeloyl-ACP methyl ester carboxylesterase